MLGARRILGEISNQTKPTPFRINLTENKENVKSDQNRISHAKLRHVPLILQRKRKKVKREIVQQIVKIEKIPKNQPKQIVKKEFNSNGVVLFEDNPYPKPPYSYMAMIQVMFKKGIFDIKSLI